MNRHPKYDMQLHTDDELAAFIGREVASREVLHQWPISYVERLEFDGGAPLIYKVQLTKSTVEPEFYDRSHSPLLPWHQTLEIGESQATMLFEVIDAPLLNQLELSEAEALDLAKRMTSEISRIEGDPPVYTDISTIEKWRRFIDATLVDLTKLIETGLFVQTQRQDVEFLRQWRESPQALRAIESNPRLSHGDPNGDNVFMLEDGFRVIDWQRPRRVAADVDKAALLQGLGFDPRRHVDPGVIGLFWCFRVNWCVECKTRWIPMARSYDKLVQEAISQIQNLPPSQ